MIRTRLLVMLLVTCVTMATAGAASAATFKVTTTADFVDADQADGRCDIDSATEGDQCSLRAAVMQANWASSADVIELPAGTYRIDKRNCGSARCDEEQAAEDDLDIKYPVTINGSGARSTVIDANSAPCCDPSTLQGIFEIVYSEPGTFAISDVTLTGANATGAAINAYGAGVELNRVTVKGNDGNGEANVDVVLGQANERLAITDSTIGPNAGKGVRTIGMPSVEITNSTIAGNGYQGYQSDFDPSVVITSSTISANGQAGLLFDSTKAPDNGGSLITLRNSIVAGNHTVSDSVEHDCMSTPAKAGANLDGDGTCNTSLQAAPLLGVLADNGGPTDTMLPAPGSPAIDAATDCAGLTLDQRGSVRPKGAACDLGAVERDPIAPSGDGAGGSGDHGSNGGGSTTGGPGGDVPGPAGPGESSTPPVVHPAPGPKARALGLYCKPLSGRDLSRCVTAMSKLSAKKAKTTAAACKGLSKKKPRRAKKSPYAVCVSGGKRLLADRKTVR